jgi:hypothetical protein
MPDSGAKTGPAPKGRNLNSLALQRQVSPPPNTPTRPEGAEPNASSVTSFRERHRPLGADMELPPAYPALKRQAIQISPFQGAPPRFE